MKQYTIYCTEEQVKKAWKLGAPIEIEQEYDESGEIEASSVITPTAEQMIGWLDDNGVVIIVEDTNCSTWMYMIESNGYKNVSNDYDTRKKATLEAIDQALTHIEENVK